MRPKPRKFEIKLDFSNNIRYFSARQHVSTSARQHVSTSARYNCVFNQHHPLFQLSYPSSAFTHIRNPLIFIHPVLPRPDG